ncbi:MAG: PIN domain-containing protein [Elusimicrobia bacterium]|nr:PIN domain-containing protein [Elusimicrobiota bacterium]
MGTVLVDAGPLIAFINRKDPDHQACVDTVSTLTQRLATVWPVVAEVSHFLVKRAPGTVERLLRLFETDDIELLPLGRDDVSRMRELMEVYANRPMDLADAALVTIAEREDIDTLLTLDRRDFSVYRPRHATHFRLLP